MSMHEVRQSGPQLQSAVCGSITIGDALVDIIEVNVEHPLGTRSCPPHSHTWYESNFVCEGAMRTGFFGGPLEEAKAGDFFVIPPGMEHEHRYDPVHPHSGIYLRWMVRPVRESGERAAPGGFSAFATLNSLKDWPPGCLRDEHGLGRLVLGLFAGAAAGHSPLRLQLAFADFLLALAAVRQPPEQRAPAAGSHSDAALLRKIELYLNDRPGLKCNVHELAASLHMSYGHLARKYKQLTGGTIVDRLTSIRLERSRELLERTDKPIREVAQVAGFASEFYFSRIFKRLTGVSPRDYREGAARER
ncbi:helix-turn-helix transcriptional regulator [Paenibacillus cymbidii]|uniref:helix-turn-helix transcriptional regulator n=1 Tax=Paenibacillus cymbidii TaxID=1639034 RepID=UPI0010800F30|nr:helix-turn-helix domain-containing protein [Paenibacillus cymbidii]